MSEDIFDDDLFSDDPVAEKQESTEIESETEVAPASEVFPSEEVTEIKDEDIEVPSYLPQLVGADYPTEYKQIVDRFLVSYSFLPHLDFDALYQELAQLSIKSGPTSTLQMINLRLQEVQASKDRLSEILQDVIRCYSFKKRTVNILSDAWGKFAEGKSADKRKADCAFRLSDFYRDLAETEALHGTCDHVLKNLDSLNHNLSRQITIIQSQLKLYDIGRGSLPDFDFNKSQLNEAFVSLGDSVDNAEVALEVASNKDIDESESKEATECSF